MAKTEYCVIGYGRFGESIADRLKELGKSVMIIDMDDSCISKATRVHEIVVKADGRDINALSDCGVKSIDTTIVAASKIDDSIMICANLRQLKVENIIARASNQTHERVLKTMGITNVIIPEIDVANKLALKLVYNMGADVQVINKNLSWIKSVVTNPAILHKTIEELDFRGKYDSVCVSIQRKDQTIFPIPKMAQFKIGDVVSIVCGNESIKKVISLLTGGK